jgi:hypothetical protein
MLSGTTFTKAAFLYSFSKFGPEKWRRIFFRRARKSNPTSTWRGVFFEGQTGSLFFPSYFERPVSAMDVHLFRF